MPACDLVSRLEHCRQVRDGEWIARCPAHDDKTPSLSIKELPDSRVLIHCHAGCGAMDILNSIGLSWSDLYPENDRLQYSSLNKKREATVDELVISIAESDKSKGKKLNGNDLQRYRDALLRTALGAAI